MTITVASAPGKIILFGEHGVHRKQPNITTTVGLRTYCRVSTRPDDRYSFRSGERYTEVTRDQLLAFKARVDALREAQALDEIAALAQDFFVPTRYVMASFVSRVSAPGFDVEWRTEMPIGSGLGSGAAASASMVRAAYQACKIEPMPEDIIYLAWQGDVIAHGGYGSSLDSSTITLGGLIRYTLEDKALRLPYNVSLPLVIGDTLVEHSTSKVNTHIRRWLEEQPARMHVFQDMGYLLQQFIPALERADLPTIGHLFNLHQLLQEKMGTSIPESERLIEAALGAGALGAKISGSGGGGIIIALATPGQEQHIAAAIDDAGGCSYVVTTGASPVRAEPIEVWDAQPVGQR
jgi:mevalonate kinase